MCEKHQQHDQSTAGAAQSDSLAEQLQAFQQESESLHEQLDEMQSTIEELVAENARLQQKLGAGASSQDSQGVSAKLPNVGDPNGLEAELRCEIERFKAEISQIKANNMKSMQMLMKELTEKDATIADLKKQLESK